MLQNGNLDYNRFIPKETPRNIKSMLTVSFHMNLFVSDSE